MIIKNNKQKGFNFIEVLISIALLILISGIILLSFNALDNKQALDKQVDFIKSSINKTRMNALNSKNSENQSIVFGTTSIRYDGISIDLSANVSLSSYTTATNTITFYKVTGFPSATGTIVYKLQKGDTLIGTSSIVINNLGVLE